MILLIFLLSSCGQPDQAPSVLRIDTTEGMIEYLQGKNLPALWSVESWDNGYGPGLRITTEHYEIYTTLLEPLMLCELPAFMESAWGGYNNQLPEPVATAVRFRVYLFAGRKQWEDFTNNFAGHQAEVFTKIKAGAYYLNDACVAYNIGRERTFSALGHEGWHQFNSRHFKFRLPSWLNEGIAMLFEANTESGGFFSFEPGKNLYRLGALKKTLMKNRMIPLKNLIALNPGEVLTANEDAAVAAFYSQSYALVRFLREEGYGKRLGNYQRMLSDGLRGNWPISETNKRIAADRNMQLTVPWNRAVGKRLFEYYIGGDIESIEDEYIVYCRKIVYHVRVR